FDPNDGGNIRELILTPSFGSKSRLKRTRKSTEAYYWDRFKGSKKARKANDSNSENVSEGGRTKNSRNKILPQRRLRRKKSGVFAAKPPQY
ncbi:MAG: hypothetical protein AB7H48_09580, partial [Parachlamydiales bacterium]